MKLESWTDSNKAGKQAAKSCMGGGYMKGSIQYHRPAKRYYVQIWWDGKIEKIWKYYDVPLTDQPIAEKLLNKIRAEIDNGTFHLKSYKSNVLSITEYSRRWLEIIDVKPATLHDYKNSVEKHIIPYFGNKDIRLIRAMDLKLFYKSIERSQKTKYNIMTCLRTIFLEAYRNEDLQVLPPFPRLSMGDVPDIKYLTREQQEKVLSFIPDRHKPVFQFAMEYGLRIGEVRALQWDCIDDAEVIIKRSFSREKLQETTKTGKQRKYGLTSYTKDILKNIQVTSATFVFVRKDGKPYRGENVNSIWKAACDEAGIHINLYNAVRHSLGCQLMDEHVGIDKIQQVLGHTRPEMTKRYVKRSTEDITKMLENRRAKVIPFRGSLEVEAP
jgi:integrase